MPTNNAYSHLKLTENATARMNDLRGEFMRIDTALRTQTLQGRYQSLALTALEEAAMWAMKSISHEGA